jgi:hypothetical protein
MQALSTQAFRTTITQAGVTVTSEFVPPDRTHIVSGNTEYILIGSNDVYLKSNGRWAKADKNSGFVAVIVLLATGYSDKVSDAQLVGTETLDGIPTEVVTYSGQVKVSGGTSDLSNPIAYKMWIGAHDGLPHKLTFQVQGQEIGTTLIQYDPSIQIQAPTVQ